VLSVTEVFYHVESDEEAETRTRDLKSYVQPANLPWITLPIPNSSGVDAMAEPNSITNKPPAPPVTPTPDTPKHEPYVPDNVNMPEFTWPSVLLGAFLGILFGASSLYLLLKVGMTVSASVPIAVLSITLFRAFSRAFGFRRATILENNIVQTTGSAGESLAFGVGVTMPALLLLGFEMHWIRVLTVSVLGGLLGILMMIPLRRAFIVKQYGVSSKSETVPLHDSMTWI
jgi:hypothetical protein